MPRNTTTTRRRSSDSSSRKVRYAVVGLGYIAQSAVLPAFAKAKNSELAALVSDDKVKLEKLGKKYKVRSRYSYDDFDQCLHSGEIDAVYIALPNSMHRDYTVRACRAGIHVLCEKPLAVTEMDCEEMIAAAADNDVKLMTAYRLHFEQANMKAVEIAQSGKLGDLRAFNSVFTMQVKDGDIRVQKELGGGTLYDIGIYCINAARYVFQDEPIEVFGFACIRASSSRVRAARVVNRKNRIVLAEIGRTVRNSRTRIGPCAMSDAALFGASPPKQRWSNRHKLLRNARRTCFKSLFR